MSMTPHGQRHHDETEHRQSLKERALRMLDTALERTTDPLAKDILTQKREHIALTDAKRHYAFVFVDDVFKALDLALRTEHREAT